MEEKLRTAFELLFEETTASTTELVKSTTELVKSTTERLRNEKNNNGATPPGDRRFITNFKIKKT